MKSIKTLIIIITLTLPIGNLFGQVLTINLEESGGACGLATDCENDVLCVDIVMTISEAKELKAYNIWVTYDQSKLSRDNLALNDNSGDGDNSCIMSNGAQDTDLEESQGAWRVAGIEGSFNMVANVPATVHTICFAVEANTPPGALNGEMICVGGSQAGGALTTTVTFSDVTYDDVATETCLTLNNSFTSCSLLPVELTKFEAEKEKDYGMLHWATSSELNNLHFEVESSNDGKNFEKIGVVLGAGTTSDLSTYDFVDRAPFTGINFYRLKQVDLNGAFEYSDVRTLDFRANGDYYVFPNPASDHIVIKTSSRELDEEAKFQLYNELGQLVKNGMVSNNSNVSVADLDNGMYILRILGSNQNVLLNQKINILK
ncbi:T9SS type A sorting domain-containing protein [Portibacter lacus]|uniref:Secretion system C-terminal sorting domain-containing protein n=1 Tax=Portibacter lacus TaxID=1099794 RepID=A0AA37SNP7_9BACT|nr:T9SS type A sorting domain-containing protein [Portibacter lacus]GLR16975.1 hypothetical protein GCM10007940_15900 [Portibacter lacus]